MQKNVASQKWTVFAFDRTNNEAKTGDAANITANLRLDGGAANGVDDTNPIELEDGYYVFDITQAETNADMIVICPVSSTANIQVIGVPGAIYTTPTAFPALTKEAIIDEFETQSQADPTGFHVNVKEVSGIAQTANDNGADINAILTDTGTTLDALIKDIPTVTEFEARSILAANYVVVGDTIAGVTAVTNDVGITQAGADKIRASVCVTGDPANSIGKALYEIYNNRLTSARAGYLANIDNANLATIADISTLTATEIAYLNASISSRSSHTATNVWAVGTRALTDKAGFTLSAAGVTAIWEKNISTFSGAGYAGTYLKMVYDDWLNAGRLDLILDTMAADVANIDGDAMRGTNSAALASVCTEARLAELAAANLPADIDNILADTGTDGVVVASDSKTGYVLTAAGVDAILDEVVEGTTTFRQMLRIFMAALAGKSAGGGTVTITFRDGADGKNRINATVDANGNRTAISLDGT